MALRRTAVGIDLGTTDVFAANVGRKGVDIVQNGVSERRTPALVGFTSRRRLLGDAAFAQVKSNYRNSCRGLKHLVGRALDSPELEIERFWSLCPLGQAEDGDVGFEVSYRGEERCISATVCLSMLITAIVGTCKAWTKMDVRDVVLAIPAYFTERSRQACLDALRIAGVHCLRLLHETTAMALAWRFDRRDLDDTKPIIVAFCSLGHSSLAVAVARFKQGTVTILSEAFDRTVAGRSMDRILLDIFAKSLMKQGAPDPLASPKAKLKLEEAATKVKKTLSVVDVARGSAECVIEDFDLTCDVKRSTFEELCAPMYGKVQETVALALSTAELQAEDLTYVEVLGGASRVPWVQRALREAFAGRELSTTLNADEAVARGCAWQAAMLSPQIRLNHIPLQEFSHHAVALEWEDSQNVEAEASQVIDGKRRLLVFEARAGPNVEAEVNLRCRGMLEVSAVLLADGQEASNSGAALGTWSLAFPEGGMQDVEVHCAVDINGLFSISKAAVCTGKEAAGVEEPGPGAGEAAGKGEEAAEARAAVAEEQGAGAGSRPAGATVRERQAEEGEAAVKAGEAGVAEAAAEHPAEATGAEPPEPTSQPVAAKAGRGVQAEAPEAQEEEPGEAFAEDVAFKVHGQDAAPPRVGWLSFNWRFWQWRRSTEGAAETAATSGAGTSAPQNRRRVGASKHKRAVKAGCKSVNVELVSSRPGYATCTMAAAVQAEQTYRATDEAVVHAENSRNDYETFIFGLRERVASGGGIMDFASPEEKAALAAEVEEAESWTYEHTQEEAAVYAERLQKLRGREQDFSARASNLESVLEKIKALKAHIRKYKASASSPAYSHIAKEKLDTIISECDSNSQWLTEVEIRQQALQKWEAPVFSDAELMVRSRSLVANATKVLSEPKPKAPEPLKKEKKDRKKREDESKKGMSEEKAQEETVRGGNAGDSNLSSKIEAESEQGAGAATSASKPRVRRWHLALGALAVVALLLLGLLMGLGGPYGLASSLASGGDAELDEAAAEAPELVLGAEPHAAEPTTLRDPIDDL